MDAEADQMCEATGNSRNGYGLRTLKTCVGELSLRVPKLRSGSFSPEDIITRYQRVDQALAAAAAEMYTRARARARSRGSLREWACPGSRRTMSAPSPGTSTPTSRRRAGSC